MTVSAWAQQALQNALALDAYKNHRQTLPEAYTFKSGDFRLADSPSVEADWNDNVFSAPSRPQDDYILRPMVRLESFYPLTVENVLSVSGGIGYDEYLRHSGLSSLRVDTGTGLSFDVALKGVSLNLHDRFSYFQDSSQQPLVARTADYGTLNNTAGVLAAYDLRSVSLSLGYDHRDVESTTGSFTAQDQESEMVFNRVGYHLSPRMEIGTEVSASFIRYDEAVLNNYQSYSIGVFDVWNLSETSSFQARVGYVFDAFDHTSVATQIQTQNPDGSANWIENTAAPLPTRTSDISSWYFDIQGKRQFTAALDGRIDFGHEVQSGLLADAVEDWYVKPAVVWSLMAKLKLTVSGQFEHGNQGVGNQSGNFVETFDWLSGGVTATYALTKKLDAALNYRLTTRSSDQGQRFTQNLVGVILTYHPS